MGGPRAGFCDNTVFLDLNVSAQSQSTILTSEFGGELSDMKYSDEALQQWEKTHGKLLYAWISELLRKKKMFGSKPARGNGLNQLQFKKIAWMFVNGKTMFTPLLAAQA